MTARPFAAARHLLAALDAGSDSAARGALTDATLRDDLRALLAAWDAEHPGAAGERWECLWSDDRAGVWTVFEDDGDDLLLRRDDGEEWEVSRDFLAAEVRAEQMRRMA